MALFPPALALFAALSFLDFLARLPFLALSLVSEALSRAAFRFGSARIGRFLLFPSLRRLSARPSAAALFLAEAFRPLFLPVFALERCVRLLRRAAAYLPGPLSAAGLCPWSFLLLELLLSGNGSFSLSRWNRFRRLSEPEGFPDPLLPEAWSLPGRIAFAASRAGLGVAFLLAPREERLRARSILQSIGARDLLGAYLAGSEPSRFASESAVVLSWGARLERSRIASSAPARSPGLEIRRPRSL